MSWPKRGARYIDGRTAHPLYGSWKDMIGRCTRPSHQNWRHYGGRGIKVCPEWFDFWRFVADVGERPAGLELDRIDNDGNYEPSNVRWATRSQQLANRRKPTHCPRGHAYAEFGKPKNGGWLCVPCNREQSRESWRRRNGYYE